MIFQGDEVGLKASNPAASRGAMPWDEKKWNRSVWNRYRSWIALRRTHPSLQRGDLRWLEASNADRFVAFSRTCAEETALVGINLGPRAREIRFEGQTRRFEPGESAIAFHGSW
jgi:glycosidase